MFLALLAAAAAASSPLPSPPAYPVTRLEATSAPPVGTSANSEQIGLTTLPGDRMTVSVSLGDHGPFNFLVDTGADRTAVSNQLAERLNLPSGKGAVLHSVTGSSPVKTVSLRGLKVAARALPDITAPLLDAVHMQADGILGTDALRSALISFDFKAGLLSISPAARVARMPRDPDTIVVEGRRKAGRLIVTDADIDGLRLTVVIDTGAEVNIGNEALRRALGRRGVIADDGQINLVSVTGASLTADYKFIRRLEIGGLGLDHLGVAFADVHSFKVMGLHKRPALLLGMNALRAFDSVMIDLASRKIRFKMPEEGSRGELAQAKGAAVGSPAL